MQPTKFMVGVVVSMTIGCVPGNGESVGESPVGAPVEELAAATAGPSAGTTAIASLPAPMVPGVTAIAPQTGPAAGGTLVTITGSNFLSGATADLGGAALCAVTVVTARTLTGVTSRPLFGPPGPLPVTVTNPGGASGTLVAPGFTYHDVAIPGFIGNTHILDSATDGPGIVHAIVSVAGVLHHTATADGGRTWTTPVTVGTSGSNARLAARGGTLVVAFSLGSGVSYRYSTDGGATWGAAIAAHTPASGTAGPHDVSLDAAGRMVIALSESAPPTPPYGTFNPRIGVVSGQPGGNLAGPVWLSGTGNVSALYPQVQAIGAGKVTVVWQEVPGSLGGPSNPVWPPSAGGWNVMLAQSTDGGVSFGGTVAVTQIGPASWPWGEATWPSLLMRGRLGWMTWREYQHSGLARIQAVRTTDGGATWSAPTTVVAGNLHLIGPGGLALNGAGEIFLSWRNDPNGSIWNPYGTPQPYAARSTDLGASWSAPVALGPAATGAGVPRLHGGPGNSWMALWTFSASPGTYTAMAY